VSRARTRRQLTFREPIPWRFDKTNVCLKDLMEILDCPDRHEAYLALRATLHALRDRLTIEETAQLAAQLPMLIRGVLLRGLGSNRKTGQEAPSRRVPRSNPAGACKL
jgi:uncharacterized protein (DUF2267 family)